jgi:hypothetical protein
MFILLNRWKLISSINKIKLCPFNNLLSFLNHPLLCNNSSKKGIKLLKFPAKQDTMFASVLIVKILYVYSVAL